MTNKRDIQPRLKQLLTEAGFRVAFMRSRSVKSKDRLDWIKKEGKRADIVISHPQSVQTGVDFFGKGAGHSQLQRDRLLRDRLQPIYDAAGGSTCLGHRPEQGLPRLLFAPRGNDAAAGYGLDGSQDGRDDRPGRQAERRGTPIGTTRASAQSSQSAERWPGPTTQDKRLALVWPPGPLMVRQAATQPRAVLRLLIRWLGRCRWKAPAASATPGRLSQPQRSDLLSIQCPTSSRVSGWHFSERGLQYFRFTLQIGVSYAPMATQGCD